MPSSTSTAETPTLPQHPQGKSKETASRGTGSSGRHKPPASQARQRAKRHTRSQIPQVTLQRSPTVPPEYPFSSPRSAPRTLPAPVLRRLSVPMPAAFRRGRAVPVPRTPPATETKSQSDWPKPHSRKTQPQTHQTARRTRKTPFHAEHGSPSSIAAKSTSLPYPLLQALRQPLHRLCLLDYIQRQLVLVALIHAHLQLRRHLHQLVRVFQQLPLLLRHHRSSPSLLSRCSLRPLRPALPSSAEECACPTQACHHREHPQKASHRIRTRPAGPTYRLPFIRSLTSLASFSMASARFACSSRPAPSIPLFTLACRSAAACTS